MTDQGRCAETPLSIDHGGTTAGVTARATGLQRGRAAAWVLGLVVLAAAGGLALLVLAGDPAPPADPGGTAPPAAGSAEPGEPGPGRAPTTRLAQAPGRSEASPTAPGPAGPDASDDAPDDGLEDLRLGYRPPDPTHGRFDAGGTGRIRGYIETSDTTPFPRAWRLVIEPSKTLVGRDRAVTRVIEFTAGEQEFVVEDLPLAGYDLRPEAPGLNGRRTPVLLDAKHRNPYVTLTLSRSGFLEGRLLDADGIPVEGVDVILASLDRPEERTTPTDAIGRYRFEGVLDGRYELCFGHRRSPVIPAEEVIFSAPSMTYPDRSLPELGTLDLLVLDPYDLPVPAIRIEGSGSAGGYLEVETDAEGRATARLLPPGRYRVSAHHPEFGRARQGVDVPGTGRVDLTLRFRGR